MMSVIEKDEQMDMETQKVEHVSRQFYIRKLVEPIVLY